MFRLAVFLGVILAANLILTAIVVLLPSTIFSPSEYANWRVSHAYRADAPVSIVLGDSRARAGVRAPQLEGNWRNLALGGATPVEIKMFYDNHAENWPELETVIIAFAGFHMERADTFERRSLQYGQMTPEQILDLRARAAAPEFIDRGGAPFLEASDKWLGYTLRLWPLSAAEIREGWTTGLPADPLHPFTQMRDQFVTLSAQYQDDQGWEARAGSIADIPERRNPTGEGRALLTPNPFIESYLSELVESSAARAQLVVITSPPHSTLTAENSHAEEYWNALVARFCAIADQHGNTIVMPIETLPERYFNDPSHLNVAGAEAWTADIAAFLTQPQDACAGPRPNDLQANPGER